ncbi:MAG: hypothetical protein Q7S40_15445 [Opitutaceae bacterium]|nr:hypothetical protein [Opitutaceae bacterium]
MTPESIKTFLRQYVSSLKEETRRTKDGDRFGFDYLIEQLGRAENWIVHRAPSHPPEGIADLPQPKKEAEHGVDFAFLTRDQRELIVFVLKDEKLTYKNFDEHNFRTDVSRASAQNLKEPELAGVTSVRIILAYNKGEEEEGIEEFDRLAQKLGTKAGDNAKLHFDRWNLDRLVDEFHAKIFSPALLPPNFFRKFTYICLQIEDFSHGSGQWEEVLIPDWREFLAQVLADASRRSVWMVAVALAIMKEHGKKEPAFATGWIDLVEWAMLALWEATLRTDDAKVAEAIIEIWMLGYVGHLEKFYLQHAASLAVEDSLSLSTDVAFEAAAESYLAFWHLARIGLLWQGCALLNVPEDKPERAAFEEGMNRMAGWIVGFYGANAGALRPVMDSQHIELFLVWSVLYGTGRQTDVVSWLKALTTRLLLRRREGGPLRVLSTETTWETVFETIVEGKPLTKSYGRTSYLILMLEEFCLQFPSPLREQLLESIHNHLVLGLTSKGESLKYPEEVELASWAPPEDWEKLILTGKLNEMEDRGVCITTGNFVRYPNQKEIGISERLLDFVKQSREMYPLKRKTNVPLPVLLLACVKFRIPVPPEFWRSAIFGPLAETPAPKDAAT